MICPACQTTNADPATVWTRCGAALSRSPLAIKRGTVLASRYEVLSLLGHGGMGTVYKAHNRMLDEVVATKTLRAEVASDMRKAASGKLAADGGSPHTLAVPLLFP